MLNTVTSPQVTIIEPTLKLHPMDVARDEHRKLKVAAYARVSTEQEEQQSSYAAQVSYYTTYIQSNPDWEFVGIYADEGISGTNTRKREGFTRMVEDAKNGKIDLILTKSISRFARNTVDALSVTRELKACNVEVRFEKERINSLDPKSEMFYTILSSLAQEESRSISENVRWGQQKSMRDGKVHMAYKHFLGYEKGPDGKPQIVESEAKIVRRIYTLFLDHSKPVQCIADELTREGIPTPAGKTVWQASTVKSILTNEKYKGDALLQKVFTVDFLTKQTKRNEGEMPQYYVKNSHPAIIEPDRWDLTQAELKRRGKSTTRVRNNSPFTTRIVCEDCGGYYGHKKQRDKDVWYCNQRFKGDKVCTTPVLAESLIKATFAEVLGKEIARIRQESPLEARLSPDPDDLALPLIKTQKRAEEARDKAIEELKELTESAAQYSDVLEYQTKHAELMAKVTMHKTTYEEATNAVLDNIACREEYRRFEAATKDLDPEKLEYSDELFIATIKKIMVSKRNTDGTYRLTFCFTNGVIVRKKMLMNS